MRLLLVLPFLAVGLAGCTNNVLCSTDPFFGRTRVLPPSTGSAVASDPAYSTRAMAAISAPALASTGVAKAPPARPTPSNSIADASRSIVPVSRSNVPLNVATPRNSFASRGSAASITPVLPVASRNPVTVNTNTTYTPLGNPYASRDNVGFRPGSTRLYSSSSQSGPGPRMTRTRVTPPSLSDHLHQPRGSVAPSNFTGSDGGSSSDGWRAPSQANRGTENRARTYGQLGQVRIDSGGSAIGLSATSSAVARTQSPTLAPPRAGSSLQPRRINLPNNVVDIMDLPPKRAGTSSASPSSKPPYGSGLRPSGASTPVDPSPSVRLVSATSDANNPYPRRLPQADKPIGFTPSPRYGHAGDHGWLNGRLEYSQVNRRWKLRYIPIDGQVDRFGGSVVLRKSSLLSGFERGDYVEVNGRLGEDATSGDYAPEYELTQIRRIER